MEIEMKDHKISWLNIPGYKGETWNPIIGCSKVSEGCDNCYAERMANRLVSNQKTSVKYAGIIKNRKWSGVLTLASETMYKPFSWKKPRAIFVCSMGDIFHESVKQEWIDKVMIIAALRPQHLFIFLTKRSERMAQYFAVGKENLLNRWTEILHNIDDEYFCICDEDGEPSGAECYIYNRAEGCVKPEHGGWPYNNIWLGVTAENQERANERIPILLSIPAVKRFVSIEPMLSDIWLLESDDDFSYNYLDGSSFCCGMNEPIFDSILDWVIVGGETGPNARLMHPDWVRSVRDQCKTAGVPFFFKQYGKKILGCELDGQTYHEFPKQ
jgi:protein gp37